jgi:hypothetical protein
MRGLPEMDESRCFVQWPIDYETTGEGGMAVFLVVPEDGWSQCSVVMPTMECDDVLVNGRELEEAIFPGSNRYRWYDSGDQVVDLTSVRLAACVCLGTTGGAYRDEEKGYFQAQVSDLTAAGKWIYNLMRQLYGRDPELLTFLDT